MPTYWEATSWVMARAKRERERLAARKAMKWARIKADFARKRLTQ